MNNSNLATVLSLPRRRSHACRIKVSIRLLPEVDYGIQALLEEFPACDFSRLVNEILIEGIDRLQRQIANVGH